MWGGSGRSKGRGKEGASQQLRGSETAWPGRQMGEQVPYLPSSNSAEQSCHRPLKGVIKAAAKPSLGTALALFPGINLSEWPGPVPPCAVPPARAAGGSRGARAEMVAAGAPRAPAGQALAAWGQPLTNVPAFAAALLPFPAFPHALFKLLVPSSRHRAAPAPPWALTAAAPWTTSR